MSKLTLYYLAGSPPARAVLMFLRYLQIDVEVKVMTLAELRSPEYLKLNPAHEVPLIVDGDFVLSESRAILQYLANSRRPGSDLYPTEAKARARVDQRLNYDYALFVRNGQIVRPILLKGAKEVSQESRDAIKESLSIIDKFLDGSKWIAGENLTIADFSALTTVTTLAEVGYNLSQHPNVDRWYKQCQVLTGFEENREGAAGLAKAIKNALNGPVF